MAIQSSQSIAAQLDRASILIANSLADTEIQVLVSAYGYSATRLHAGLQLYEAAVAAISTQAVAAGAQRRATLHAAETEQLARQYYKVLATIARSLFERGSAERTMLGLLGKVPKNQVKFLATATTLFDNAVRVAAIASALEEYGYSADRLVAERAAVVEFSRARQAQAKAMSAAIEATRVQTEALQALAKWVTRYRTIAVTALSANPQLAERISIAVRTTPSAKRNKAGAPAA